MRNPIVLGALLLVAWWPFGRRTRGRHRTQEPPVTPQLTTFPQGAFFLRHLTCTPRLDVVAGRRRRRECAEQANGAPFPPPPVERSEHFSPRDWERPADDPGVMVRPYIYMYMTQNRTERQGRHVDPWTG